MRNGASLPAAMAFLAVVSNLRLITPWNIGLEHLLFCRQTRFQVNIQVRESIADFFLIHIPQKKVNKSCNLKFSTLLEGFRRVASTSPKAKFIRRTSQFALCLDQCAQRKVIPRRNLIKTMKLWKESTAELWVWGREKERQKERESQREKDAQSWIRFSSLVFTPSHFLSYNLDLIFKLNEFRKE